MRVFLTGATGFIGTEVTRDLIEAGHAVLGLSRSDKGAGALAAAGAEVHRGDLEDLDSLRKGAAACDGVIHCGFIHDFSRFQEVCEVDRRAIEAIGDALAGSDRPFVVTSGTGMGTRTPGQPATEDHFDPNHPNPRLGSEIAAEAVADRGVRVTVVRLPQVHDTLKQGLVTPAIAVAREKGLAAYVGDGLNRWPAVHVLDAAPVYRLALEKGPHRARYHAVAEEGVTARAIAEAIGRGLKIPVVSLSPEEAAGHFGWMAMFVGWDMPASSKLTQERLGWRPTQKAGMIEDLDHMNWSGG
ncbi:SDR family oxidoreductase [Paludisphaera mucosa]|uniref:SDR family oxidoreductase n=1 Tax=Paludisphaera mucosa TaxID=3030827 RepID=A0ABT6FFN1_9BACT|nr:SDR family oxidoreductase [Paludisphaera mucosa]MDG3006369.1 SDR family oxidoreductase [Paludisphaera mucosa]